MDPHRNAVRLVEGEKRLLERLCAGDEAAHEMLVRIHGPQMLALARRFLPGDADAEDVVEDALVRACHTITEFTGKTRLATWLHRLVVDAALAKLRNRRRQTEAPLRDIRPVTAEPAPVAGYGEWQMTTADAMARSELRAQVRASIDLLPEADRLLVLLRDVERMNHRDIVGLLGIGANTAKVRLRRGRNALRTLLDPVMGNGRFAIPCTPYEDLLCAWFDDELSGARRANVEAHLAACPSCRAILNNSGQTRAMVGAAYDHPGDVLADLSDSHVLSLVAAMRRAASGGSGSSSGSPGG